MISTCFYLKITAAESHRFQQKKIEDEELEELIGHDQRKTLQELSESLNVDKSTVSRRLHSIGLVQKLGN